MSRFGVVALVLLALAPGPSARAVVEHHHLTVGYQYLPSGTVSVPVAGTHVEVFAYPLASGDPLTFTQLDLDIHTVTACDPCDPFPNPSPAFGSPPMGPGDSWTLDTSTLGGGTYRYYCIYHPYMRGAFTIA